MKFTKIIFVVILIHISESQSSDRTREGHVPKNTNKCTLFLKINPNIKKINIGNRNLHSGRTEILIL